MRDPSSIFLTIYFLSFFNYNLIAPGDYRHLSFPFCNESLPRVNFVILSSSLPPSKTFPNLVHSLNKNSSTAELIKLRRPSGFLLTLFYRIKHRSSSRPSRIRGTALMSKEKLDKIQMKHNSEETRSSKICRKNIQICLFFEAGRVGLPGLHAISLPPKVVILKLQINTQILDRFRYNFNTICQINSCLLYTSPSPRDRQKSRMPSSA